MEISILYVTIDLNNLSIYSSLTLLLIFPVFLNPQAVILPLCTHTIYKDANCNVI